MYDVVRAAYGGVIVCQQATFYASDAYRLVGGLNVANKTSWDGELLVDFALAGVRFRRIPETLGVFSMHDQSITVSGRTWDESVRNHRRIFTKVMKRAPRWTDRPRRIWSRGARWMHEPFALARGRLERLVPVLLPLDGEALRWMMLPPGSEEDG